MPLSNQAIARSESDADLDAELLESVSEEVFAKSEDAFRSIGEAAAELGLKTHVLRFWETRFENLKPMKRADGRRYYRREDMELLRRLQNLLHVQGLTIRGAIRALEEGEDAGPGLAGRRESPTDEGAEEMLFETGASVRDLQAAVRQAVERGDFRDEHVTANDAARDRLASLLADLTELKSRVDAVRAAA